MSKKEAVEKYFKLGEQKNSIHLTNNILLLLNLDIKFAERK